MEKYAVIVAGGAGLRMGSSVPKQFLLLQHKPVLWHTLTAFHTAFDDIKIILVLPALHIEKGKSIVTDFPFAQQVTIAEGGETRFQSVKNGLQLVGKDSIVFVHDGVRCLVTPALIRQCYKAALEKGNAVPATRSVDSVRIENEQGNAVADRNNVRIIQTPQTFLAAQLLTAFGQPYDTSFTDEATVVERMGIPIQLVEGEISNIKITSPLDMLLAEKLLEERSAANQRSSL